MSLSVSQATRVRRSKGEQTRLAILESTLEVIAGLGLKNVTHRAVAARAGVQLSLTTYYFRDIDDLLQQAFTLFCERSRPGYEELWSRVFEHLAPYSRSELRRTDTRQSLVEALSAMALDYLMTQVRHRPTGLAVEQTLFSAVRHSAALAALAEQHRGNLLGPLVRFCATFNKADPEIDAELLLDSLMRLEHQALVNQPARVEQERLLRLVRRQLGWVVGLQRA